MQTNRDRDMLDMKKNIGNKNTFLTNFRAICTWKNPVEREMNVSYML